MYYCCLSCCISSNIQRGAASYAYITGATCPFLQMYEGWMYVARLSVCRWYGFEERLDRVAAKDILLAAHSWGRWRFALLTLISTVVGASLSERTKSHESEIYRPGVGPTTKGGCCFIYCSVPLLSFFAGKF